MDTTATTWPQGTITINLAEGDIVWRRVPMSLVLPGTAALISAPVPQGTAAQPQHHLWVRQVAPDDMPAELRERSRRLK